MDLGEKCKYTLASLQAYGVRRAACGLWAGRSGWVRESKQRGPLTGGDLRAGSESWNSGNWCRRPDDSTLGGVNGWLDGWMAERLDGCMTRWLLGEGDGGGGMESGEEGDYRGRV